LVELEEPAVGRILAIDQVDLRIAGVITEIDQRVSQQNQCNGNNRKSFSGDQ